MTNVYRIPPVGLAPTIGDIWAEPSVNILWMPSTFVSNSVKLYVGTNWVEVWNAATGYQLGTILMIALGATLPYGLHCNNGGPTSSPVIGDVLIELNGDVFVHDGSNWRPRLTSPVGAIAPATPAQTNPVPLRGAAPPQYPQNVAIPALPITQPSFILEVDSPILGHMFTLEHDGTITYGPNYTPDTAAQTLWGAVYGAHPDILQKRVQELEKKLAVYESSVPTGPSTIPTNPLTDYDRAMRMFP